MTLDSIVNWIVQRPWIWLAIICHLAILGTVAYLILLERKTASWVQDRIGPNRVGLDFGILPFKFLKRLGGLGQPLADGIKFILKEDYRPKGVDKILFTIAPVIMIVVIIISIAVLPWGGWKQSTNTINVTGQPDRQSYVLSHIPATATLLSQSSRVVQTPGRAPMDVVDVVYRWPFQIAELNIGVLYVLAVLSLAVYGVVIGGWASNNKYSFLGGLRATANMISYEIPLGLAVLCIVLMYGTLNLNILVDRQCHYWLGFIPAWNVFTQPLAFLMFLVCIHAEANRAPFDLAEAEQELVGGYHTEYSAMRFALFFLAEYAGMVTTSAVCVALFFGGWHLPWIEWIPGLHALGGNVDPNFPSVTTSLIACIVRAIVFFSKTLLIIFVFMWVRWSLPRFRFDQLMMLAWRALIPVSLGLFMMTGVCLFVIGRMRQEEFGIGLVSGWDAIIYLVGNAAVLFFTVLAASILPAAPATNRKVVISNSRFRVTPLPGGPVGVAALDRGAAASLAVDSVPASSGRMG